MLHTFTHMQYYKSFGMCSTAEVRGWMNQFDVDVIAYPHYRWVILVQLSSVNDTRYFQMHFLDRHSMYFVNFYFFILDPMDNKSGNGLPPKMRVVIIKLPITNYANPVYGVAAICHQVRWLRWGHPSLFHTATSLLIWYNMFCVRDISYRLIWMEFINMFSVYAQSGTHGRFNW